MDHGTCRPVRQHAVHAPPVKLRARGSVDYHDPLGEFALSPYLKEVRLVALALDFAGVLKFGGVDQFLLGLVVVNEILRFVSLGLLHVNFLTYILNSRPCTDTDRMTIFQIYLGRA